MPRVPRIRTPQFQSALERKLRNLFPGYEPHVTEADRGIRFVLRDRQGRVRSRPVRLYRYHPGILTEATLKRLIRQAGNPASGLPRGL